MKYAVFYIMAIVLCVLVCSGCGDKKDTISEIKNSQISLGDNTTIADVMLAEGNVSITDTEIEEMEQEMKELEALIIEMEKEENITIEEI
ncbi:MAG: hypothetical protein H5T43_06980 [Methanomethylovorans sp.]|jgi:hypothetical protein|nr:hypothetical protein [Methanomethylovorans sp.]